MVRSSDEFENSCIPMHWQIQGQGAYNSGKHGKHGNLREFVNSGKFRENSGNLKFTQGIYQMLLIVI